MNDETMGIKKHKLMLWLGKFLVLVLWPGLLLSCSSGAGNADRPNVLFIAVDDLNDWANYRGNTQVLSPNMDSLAAQGLWFSRAYCQYPLCGPSRSSVMSGMYYHQLQPDKLQVEDSFVQKQVQSMESELLHAYFKKYGYKTMAVGKLLHHHLPLENLDMSGGRGSWDHNLDEDGKQLESHWHSSGTMTDWAPFQGLESEMSDSKAADWAVQRLNEQHEDPFILMVGFLRPHVPWHVPQKYLDLYDPETLSLPEYKKDDFDDIPEAGLATLGMSYPRTEWAIENHQWRNMLQSYLACITFVDTKIGQVLKALEASLYYDNTIVILWSDHGYHMGEKNTFQKHTFWNRSALAPLILKLPPNMKGEMKKGRCDRVVGLIDIYPTLLDLCGLPANDKLMGRSLKPLLADHDLKWEHPAYTFGKDDGRSLQSGDYRLIEYGDGSLELYDHGKDPHEWNNLARVSGNENVLAELLPLFGVFEEGED